MTKAILFDLDNTLYDYDSAHKKALKVSYEKIKNIEDMSFVRFKKLYMISRKEIHTELSGTASAHNRVLYFQRMMEKIKGTVDPKSTLSLSQSYWNGFLSAMKIAKNAKDVLKLCKKKGIKTAIVSDLTTKIQLTKLEKLGISDHIDVLVTSEEAGSDKPHSIMFLLALNKLEVKPKEAMMVGDDLIADIEGANIVGMNTVLVSKRKVDIGKEEYTRPDKQIKSIEELKEIIEVEDIDEKGYIKFDCKLTKTRPPAKAKVKELNRYRQKLYRIGLIGAYKNKVGFGNISVRKNGEIIISGSATGNIKTLTEKHYSIITDYDIKKNRLSCKGQVKASSESMTHAAIYECSNDIGAVIHVHNSRLWKKYLGKLPTTSPDASYGTPKIAYEIKRLYKKGDFKKKRIAVLGGHKEGIIVFGKDLKEAFSTLEKYIKK